MRASTNLRGEKNTLVEGLGFSAEGLEDLCESEKYDYSCRYPKSHSLCWLRPAARPQLLLEVRKARIMGGVPREQTMLKGHLPRVIYHRVYSNIRKLFVEVPRDFSFSGGYPRDRGCPRMSAVTSAVTGTDSTIDVLNNKVSGLEW